MLALYRNGKTSDLALERLIDRIYEASLEESAWQPLLGAVAEACDARAAVLVARDQVSGALSFADEVGLDSDYRHVYLQRLRYEDLRLEDLIRHPLGTVRTDTMIERYQDYLASRAYRELYSRLGTEHALGAFLVEEGRQQLALRLFRSRRQGPFDERAVRRYRRLVPHLTRALRLRRRSEALRRESRSGAAALALLPWPLFQLTAESDPHPLNAAGRRLLAERPGLAPQLARLTSDAAPGLATLDLAGASQRESWHCRLQRSDAGQGRQTWIALLAAAEQAQEPPAGLAEGLTALFGLTPAEARLTACLCRGQTLAGAAKELGIARETARSHLRSCFAKTRTNRQVDLVRLAGTSLAALGAPA